MISPLLSDLINRHNIITFIVYWGEESTSSVNAKPFTGFERLVEKDQTCWIEIDMKHPESGRMINIDVEDDPSIPNVDDESFKINISDLCDKLKHYITIGATIYCSNKFDPRSSDLQDKVKLLNFSEVYNEWSFTIETSPKKIVIEEDKPDNEFIKIETVLQTMLIKLREMDEKIDRNVRCCDDIHENFRIFKSNTDATLREIYQKVRSIKNQI